MEEGAARRAVVLVKTAPGGAADSVDAFERAGRALPGVLSTGDAHAVEAALRLREADLVSEVVIVAVSASSEILGGVREALAMGADRAFLVADDRIDTMDIAARAKVVAALLGTLSASVTLFGPWSGDIDGSLLLAAAAQHCAMPLLGQARTLACEGDMWTAERQTEAGDVLQAASSPCLVEVSEALNRPRRATMRGLQAARSRPVKLIALDALGIEVPSARTRFTVLGPAPIKRATQMVEGGQAAEEILAFLQARGFAL